MLTEDGPFALFFRPLPGGFDSSRVPTLGEFAIQGRKNANPGGSARESAGGGGGWAQVTDALIEKLTFLGIGCESKGAFKSHSRPDGP